MEAAFAKEASQNETEFSVSSLDHISIAVPNLAKASALYREKFRCIVSDPLEIPEQGIRIAYVYLGNAKLELMEPFGDRSSIARFIENNPAGGLHHFCLTTLDVDAAAKSVKDEGMRVLGGGSPKAGRHGRKLFFIHPKDTFGSLIEIEEAEPEKN